MKQHPVGTRVEVKLWELNPVTGSYFWRGRIWLESIGEECYVDLDQHPPHHPGNHNQMIVPPHITRKLSLLELIAEAAQ